VNTALVTGASRGIGRAIATRLCELGYDVLALGRDVDALNAWGSECLELPGRASTLAGNLVDPAFIDHAVATAQNQLGRIDVLVNNAGTTDHAAVQHADMTAWQAVLDLNFASVMRLSQRVLPEMIERESGAVINISSISGRNSVAGSGIYAATKHALIGFSGCLFEDVREHGVKVSTILPGFVETKMTERLKMDQSRMIAPDDIADAVEFVLSSSTRCCPTEIVIRPQRAP